MTYDEGDDSSATTMADFGGGHEDSDDEGSVELLPPATPAPAPAPAPITATNRTVHSPINKKNTLKRKSKSVDVTPKSRPRKTSVVSPASQTLDALLGLDADAGRNLMLTPTSTHKDDDECGAGDPKDKEGERVVEKTKTGGGAKQRRQPQPQPQPQQPSSSKPTHTHAKKSYRMHVVPFTDPSRLGMHIVEISKNGTCAVGEVYPNTQAFRLGVRKGDVVCDPKNGGKEAAYEDVIAWSSKTRSERNPLMLMIKRGAVQDDADHERTNVAESGATRKNVSFSLTDPSSSVTSKSYVLDEIGRAHV